MSQLDRLQSLLERVQRNRAQPRAEHEHGVAAGSAVAVARTATPSAAPPAVVKVAAPARVASATPAPVAAPARARSMGSAPPPSRPRQSTPLEQAVEGQVAERATGGIGSPAPRSAPPAPRSAPPVPRSLPPVVAAQPGGPQRIEPQLPTINQPVAQLLTAPPRVEELTFGDLLRRSLSLRPQ